MATDAEFLDAIRIAPRDDALRMVYADWLEDQGDPRGSWLRLEVELFSSAPGEDVSGKRERLFALEESLDRQWLAQVDRAVVPYCPFEKAPTCPEQWLLFEPTDHPCQRLCSQCHSRVAYCRSPDEMIEQAESQQVAIASSFDRQWLQDCYADFTLFAVDSLVQRMQPLEDEVFWPVVEEIDWKNNSHVSPDVLGRKLASHLSLSDLIRATRAAFYHTYEISVFLDDHEEIHIWSIIPSSDGMDDFRFHVLGLGEAFFTQFFADPEPALQIARDYQFVESFRYVFQSARENYSFRDYVQLFENPGLTVGSETAEGSLRGRMLAQPPTMPGVIVRVDSGSVHVVNPIRSRDIPWPPE